MSRDFFLSLFLLLALHPRTAAAETVWTDGGSEAELLATFPNGEALVRIGKQAVNVSRSQLASPGCANGLCSGARVWTDAGREGTVNGFFPNGYASVRIGTSHARFTQSQLAREGCAGALCTGDSVATRSGARGTVNGPLPVRRALSVRIGASNYLISFSELAKIGGGP